MKKMTKGQVIIVAVMGLVDILVLCGLGYAFLSSQGSAGPPVADLPPATEPAVTATLAPTPAERTYVPVFEPTDCPFEPPPEATVDCGFVLVPEDREGDFSDTVRLAVAIYRATGLSPAPDPVFYLHGGPGGDVVEASPAMFASFGAPIVERRDLVYIDQRGAGLSQPHLDCPEIKDLYLEDLHGRVPAEERGSRYVGAVTACRDRLTSGGADLAAYTSTASATDVQDVAKVLGYEQINLYGVSYGTRLALTVMRDHPDIVRSAVLDSVLPIETRFDEEEEQANRQRTLELLFEDCQASEACDVAYPQLETVTYEVIDLLDAEPITIQVPYPSNASPYTTTVDGDGLANAIIWSFHSSKLIPIVPQAIYGVKEGDYRPLSYALALPPELYEGISLGAMISINCHEHVFASTPEEIEGRLTSHHLTGVIDFAAIRESGLTVHAICEMWGAAPFDPNDGQPMVSNTPTLILAGAYDPTTPPAYGRRVAENLSRSYFFEFPGLGHGPSLDDPCPLNFALAFLDAPSADPYRVCVAKTEGPEFHVPSERAEAIILKPFTDPASGISGVVPSGWDDVGLGLYSRNRSPIDVAQIGMQTSYISQAEWLDYLTIGYQEAGLSEAPTVAGQRRSGALTWTLYTSTAQGTMVDLAMTESDGLTLLVVLYSTVEEHARLYEEVFLPVVDGLVTL